MNVEIANPCPRCAAPVFVAPMHAGGILPMSSGSALAYDLALGYQCVPCDWYVVQPVSSSLPAADFLAKAVGSGKA